MKNQHIRPIAKDGSKCKYCGSVNTSKCGYDAYRCQDCWSLNYKDMTGIELIAIERGEQIEKHGRTVKDDVYYNDANQLSEAASLLAYDQKNCLQPEDIIEDHTPSGWNKDVWDKMVKKPYKERLIIAGALIAAEIDRIQHDDTI